MVLEKKKEVVMIVVKERIREYMTATYNDVYDKVKEVVHKELAQSIIQELRVKILREIIEQV